MDALRQTRVLRHWSATSLISARIPIAASTTSIKLNLFEHQINRTKQCARCTTTIRCCECLEQTRQKHAKAIQIYKDVSDIITEKREEAGWTVYDYCRDLDLAVGLKRVLHECQLRMRQRIEKAAREVAENLPPKLGKSEKLKARLDIGVKTRRLLVASKSSTEKVSECDYARKEDLDDIDLEKADAYSSDWMELSSRIEELKQQYDEEVLDTISEVEKDLEDIWREAVLLQMKEMKHRGF
jgi:hypothetical protein